MASESPTAVYAALAGNASIGILKGIVAVLTGSSAMLAEMFHSIADTGNQLLLLVGVHLGKRPPDAQHPFGHGMNVYFWAFVVSVMLFTLGGGLAIWEAVRTFLHAEHEARDFFWAYIVLGGSAVFEGGSLAFAVAKTRRRMRPDQTFREFWRESRDPTLLTVLLEDSAALMSLAVAAIGIMLVQRTHDIVWDGIASATIGGILLLVAIALAFENYSMLLGETAPRKVEDRVRAVVGRERDVEQLTYLHSLQLGPDLILLAIGARFKPRLDTEEIRRAIERLHVALNEVLDARTTNRLILIEPAGAQGHEI
jgi:cation diffusion facilitator family transporter